MTWTRTAFVRPSFKRVRINSLYFTKTEVSNLLPLPSIGLPFLSFSGKGVCLCSVSIFVFDPDVRRFKGTPNVQKGCHRYWGLAGWSQPWRNHPRVQVVDHQGAPWIGSNSGLVRCKICWVHPQYLLEHVRDTLRSGKGINYESMVRLTQEIPQAFSFLSSWALVLQICDWSCHRPCCCGDIPGAILVRTLARRIRDRTQIDVQNVTTSQRF
jgi:hypothetical protein